ncbi:MAG: hypothetical protein KatS3mg129_1136 [Leptospiraceae bacterium]|nr:MAG: hypothetical protein KatS3mg129_1136 [Leptospiraceae bacterium]
MKNSESDDLLPHEFYLELWKQSLLAIGRTSPNPPVASIITDKNSILSSGATEPPGKRHAEIVALDELDKISINPDKKLNLYVTLEPCSTYGRTKPCVLRIKNYKNKIKKIFIENYDPYLNKTGVKYLLENDFEIQKIEIFKKPHFALEPFFSVINKKKPVYYIKIATDKNGFIGINQKSISITGKLGKIITMLFRAKVDAVIVGPGTTAIDRPSLNIRNIEWLDLFSQELKLTQEELLKQTKFLRNFDSTVYYDEFLRGLFIFYNDILKVLENFNYQPKRIFILGRNFENFMQFYFKQKEITENTGQKFYLIIQKRYKEQFPLKDIST